MQTIIFLVLLGIVIVIVNWFVENIWLVTFVVGGLVVIWIIEFLVESNKADKEREKVNEQLKAEERAALQQEAQMRAARTPQNLSLTCNKCGSLSAPISGTGNRYRCNNCGHQFVSAKHNYYPSDQNW